MSRRAAAAALVAAVSSLVACFELSAPPAGLSAISPIRAAWPSVVVGDVMRDENTDVAPLQVDAYDADGKLVTDATISFVVLDTGLRVDADGTVHGLNVRTTPARVVAQVRRGGDVLQTLEDSIDVVPPPDSVTPTPGRDTTFAAKPFDATVPAPINAEPMSVKTLNRAASGAAVKSWVVRYEIVEQPPGANGQNTALFSGGGEARVSVDTTDAGGVASRTIALQVARLDPTQLRDRQDVRVVATVRGVGAGDPVRTVTFVLPFARQ